MPKPAVHEVRAGEGLADHFISITEKKWAEGPSEESVNLSRYQGIIRGSDGVPWQTPETQAAGCLAFMREVTHFEPKPYQEDIVWRMYRNKRLSVRAPRKAGKSACSANIVIHFAAVNPVCKVITTASSWQQLEDYLWPEITLWAKQADWSIIGREPKMNLMDLSFGDFSTAVAVRSDEPAKIEGAHSRRVLILLDEAKSIEDGTFDALEGTLAFGEVYALMVSTPGPPVGRFYAIQTKKPGLEDWDVKHITRDEMEEGIDDPEKRAEYSVWCEQRRKQWGDDHPMYRNHVLGEFADVNDKQIIPTEWIEAAQERWRAWRGSGFDPAWLSEKARRLRICGLDIAGEGKDRTAIAHRIGNAIREVRFSVRGNTMSTVQAIMAFSGEYPRIHVEADAMGLPIYERFKEILANRKEGEYVGVTAHSIISGSKTERKDRTGQFGFFNMRSFMWWNMRELLDPGNAEDIMLPDLPDLLTELSMPQYDFIEGSRIKVESKKDIRKRMNGKSTDIADSIIFTFALDGAPIVIRRYTAPALQPRDRNVSPYGIPRAPLWGR